MRLSFVHNENPLIAGVVRERRPRECAAEIKNCEYHGANVIDLHLSCLDDELRQLRELKR